MELVDTAPHVVTTPGRAPFILSMPYRGGGKERDEHPPGLSTVGCAQKWPRSGARAFRTAGKSPRVTVGTLSIL